MRRRFSDIKIINPSEDESGRMDLLWRQFEKDVIWPGEKFEEEQPDVVPLTKLEQIYRWEDWAMEHFVVEAVS